VLKVENLLIHDRELALFAIVNQLIALFGSVENLKAAIEAGDFSRLTATQAQQIK
jgi:hypothetical protein